MSAAMLPVAAFSDSSTSGEGRPVIHAAWTGPDLRAASPTWRLLHLDEAAAAGELDGCEPGAGDVLAEGWPVASRALSRAAWWVAEALWRDGVASHALTQDQLRRARQIGTALVGTTLHRAPMPASEAVWHASALFDPAERVLIRLQLAPLREAAAVDGNRSAAFINLLAPSKAQRLAGFARAAVHIS